MANGIVAAVALLSVCPAGGVSDQSSAYRTVALEGQTALLSCTFTFTGIEHLTIEWTKDEKDLSPKYMLTFRSGREDYDMKNPRFQHRTQLFVDELSKGNASLRISDVSLSDAGKYICKTIQDSGTKEREVELFVGSASEPKFLEVSFEAEGVSLRCEASCWFPQPQMSFLDEQGKVMSSENSTERMDGTGCFTVTGRSTVSAGRFICRVHQPDINLTRDAEIHVRTQSRAEHVASSSSCSICVAMAILLLVAVIICIFIICKLCVLLRGRKPRRHSDPDIEGQNSENERSEEMSRLTGDPNQTSESHQSLSRSASVVLNSRERPPVQENCSRPETSNAAQFPESTNPPDSQKKERRILRQHSAPAQLFNTNVIRRSRLTSLSHDRTPETSPLMEDSED